MVYARTCDRATSGGKFGIRYIPLWLRPRGLEVRTPRGAPWMSAEWRDEVVDAELRARGHGVERRDARRAAR